MRYNKDNDAPQRMNPHDLCQPFTFCRGLMNTGTSVVQFKQGLV